MNVHTLLTHNNKNCTVEMIIIIQNNYLYHHTACYLL